MLTVSRALVATCALLAAAPAAAGDDWAPEGEQAGVILHSRQHPTLGAREVRAVAEVTLPAAEVFATVVDYVSYPQFLPGMTDARLVGLGDARAFAVYLRYEPQYVVVQARDVVLSVRVDRDRPDGSFRSEWRAEAGLVAEVDGVVRMPLNTGSWTVEPLDAGRCRLTYVVAVSPGGWIPDWLVRWGAAKALPEVIERLVERTRARK